MDVQGIPLSTISSINMQKNENYNSKFNKDVSLTYQNNSMIFVFFGGADVYVSIFCRFKTKLSKIFLARADFLKPVRTDGRRERIKQREK